MLQMFGMRIEPQLLFAFLIFIVGTAFGGDYFPYRTTKISYELKSPFDDPASPSLPDAKLEIETAKNKHGTYEDNLIAILKSVKVVIGESEIAVPNEILKEMGHVSLATTDFFWVGGNYYFAIENLGMREEQRRTKFEVAIRDGAISDVRAGRESIRHRFPEHFAARRQPNATETPNKAE